MDRNETYYLNVYCNNGNSYSSTETFDNEQDFLERLKQLAGIVSDNCEVSVEKLQSYRNETNTHIVSHEKRSFVTTSNPGEIERLLVLAGIIDPEEKETYAIADTSFSLSNKPLEDLNSSEETEPVEPFATVDGREEDFVVSDVDSDSRPEEEEVVSAESDPYLHRWKTEKKKILRLLPPEKRMVFAQEMEQELVNRGYDMETVKRVIEEVFTYVNEGRVLDFNWMQSGTFPHSFTRDLQKRVDAMKKYLYTPPKQGDNPYVNETRREKTLADIFSELFGK